jgi:hypothetical protein
MTYTIAECTVNKLLMMDRPRLCVVLKLGRFGQIRNTWKVLKCGAEE